MKREFHVRFREGVGVQFPRATRPYSYSQGDSTQFSLTAHPTMGGYFADDAIPAVRDTINDYGRLGFGTAGYLPCAGWGDQAQGGGQDGAGGDGIGQDGAGDQPIGTDGDQNGGGDQPAPTDVPLPYVTVLMNHGAITFDAGQRQPVPIGSVTFPVTAAHDALVATGAIDIQKEFPGSTPADTVIQGFDGKWVHLPDVSGFYRVRYASPEQAVSAAATLGDTPGIRYAQAIDGGLVQDLVGPNDPYFQSFQPDTTKPVNYNPQWFLLNTQTTSDRPPCYGSIPGMDIGLLDHWWDGLAVGPHDPYPDPPVVVGMADTGLYEYHEDLPIEPVSDENFVDWNTHPRNEQPCLPHGTAMAGLLGAYTNDSTGTAGVCPNCSLLSLESTPLHCDCAGHGSSCETLEGYGRHAKSAASYYFQQPWHYGGSDLKVINVEHSKTGSAALDEVEGLWSAYKLGAVIVAPAADNADDSPHRNCPADLPFVVGVGGFTQHGYIWDGYSNCDLDSLGNHDINKGTRWGAGVDLCAPADPHMATTDSSGGYDWTGGQCSGASAITAGAIGYLWNYWRHNQTAYSIVPSPDDMVGVIEATATPWDPPPPSYSRCTSCTEKDSTLYDYSASDFGRGRLNIDRARLLLNNLFVGGEALQWSYPFIAHYGDANVRVETSTYKIAHGLNGLPDTLVKQYKLIATIHVPPSAGFNPTYIAWANTGFTWLSGSFGHDERTTTFIAYGDTTMPPWLAHKQERLYLALQKQVRGCKMSPIDPGTGNATLIGYDFEYFPRVGGNGSAGHWGPGEFVEPLGSMQMVYTVVSTTNPTTGVSRSRSEASKPAITALGNPSTGPVRLQYRLPSRGAVKLEVFDVGGRMVASLDQGIREAGVHMMSWAGPGGTAAPASSGVYWVSLRAGGQVATKKIIVLP